MFEDWLCGYSEIVGENRKILTSLEKCKTFDKISFEIPSLYYLENMTLYEFIAMDEMEQQEAIWEGVHVGDRDDGGHRILLYQFDNFYVEVYYHKECNVVRRYRPFSSTNPLEPYLNQIDIQKTLKL